MKSHTRILMIAFIVAALSSTSTAGPWAPVSVYKLVPQAGVIIVGRLEAATGSGAVQVLTISTIRVLRGQVVPGERLDVFWEAPSQESPPSGGGQLRGKADQITGIWFLRARDGGGWTLLPASIGDGPWRQICLQVSADAPSASFAYVPEADIYDKILNEVGATLEASNGAAAVTLPLTREPGAPGAKRMREICARFAKSQSVKLREVGLAGLIGNGDISALQQYASEVAAGARLNIGDVIALSPNPDPAAVAAYGAILTQRPRSDVAYALRVVHTREALPFLAMLLDADDWRLRYQGMAGLAEFANGLSQERKAEATFSTGLPSGPYSTAETRQNFVDMPSFRKNEQQYIQFWKNWWANFQAK